jgi:hypothetical protein
MPAAIVEALPSLAAVLEYKLVNRDPLLVDVEADLIVDILPDAIQGHGTVDTVASLRHSGRRLDGRRCARPFGERNESLR